MQPNDEDVSAFIEAVPSPTRRRDAWTLLEIMQRISGEKPRLWGPSIIGFGRYHYKYDSGVEGDAGAAGFSPRQAAMTVYFPNGFDAYASQLARLGPHKTSVSCLYLGSLAKIDLAVLEEMIIESYRVMTTEISYGHLTPTSSADRPVSPAGD